MRAEFRDRWRAWLAYLLLAAVFVVVVLLPLVGGRDVAPRSIAALGIVDLFAGQILLAAFLMSWFLLQQRAGWRDFFALPSGSWRVRIAVGVRIGLFGWVVTLAAMAVLGVLTRVIDLEPRPGFPDLIVWMASRSLGLRLALILSAMTIEEAFFRAFLQPRIGVFGATACFAISHLNYGSPAMGGGVFVIGLILALAFRRHHDLLICAIAHGTFDSIQLLVILPWVAARL